jgi:hypothetical protein
MEWRFKRAASFQIEKKQGLQLDIELGFF